MVTLIDVINIQKCAPRDIVHYTLMVNWFHGKYLGFQSHK